jgi:hypothetical protein
VTRHCRVGRSRVSEGWPGDSSSRGEERGFIDRQLDGVLGRDGQFAGRSCACFADAQFVSPVRSSGSGHGSPATTGQNQCARHLRHLVGRGAGVHCGQQPPGRPVADATTAC